MMNDVAAVGAVVAVLLLLGLYRRLARMPSQVWSIARDDLGRARGGDEAAARRALQEAADKRATALLAAIRQYQDDIAAQFRRQVADAEVRVRVVERHAVDTGVALETATALVRELRAGLERLGALREADRRRPAALLTARPAQAAPPALASPTAPPALAPEEADAEGTRKTVEIKPAAAAGPGTARVVDSAGARSTGREAAVDDDAWDDPNEETKVIATDGARVTRMLGPLRVPDRRPPPVPRVATIPPPPENGVESKKPT